MKVVRSNKIRNSAKGQSCTVRLVGICNHNSETVVFAHVGRHKGTAIKCGDNFGVYACSSCHDEIDRRTRHMAAHEVWGDLLDALEETQQKLFDKGLLKAE
ncbi:DUF1364 family protein [Shewanella sp. 202IG2-18]|uniref:nuclease domain-containing protein n=1 Tax=Parashewanella hymeniacidonis TaxID=2807618 RepID=UPI001960C915|nr:nuclease domain-containing protein [Parashewanella hymeniacidonis]MBM7070893.1 DUF1364 family protein [Parashewanella hymeniacidonis]